MLDENKDLYYVGSTIVAIGIRFKEYFSYDSDNKCIKSIGFKNISFLTTLCIAGENKFLALALEYFMISKLQPAGNKNLKYYFL